MVRGQLHSPKPVENGGSPTNATYPKGIALHVTPRIPRACSSALVPVGFKVNVPTGEKNPIILFAGEKNKPFFFHKTERLIMRRDEGKKQRANEDNDLFFSKSDANIRSNWRVKSHLYILKST